MSAIDQANQALGHAEEELDRSEDNVAAEGYRERAIARAQAEALLAIGYLLIDIREALYDRD